MSKDTYTKEEVTKLLQEKETEMYSKFVHDLQKLSEGINSIRQHQLSTHGYKKSLEGEKLSFTDQRAAKKLVDGFNPFGC